MDIERHTLTEVGIGEIDTLDESDYKEIVICVGRRNEPGAGAFAGIQFLTQNQTINRFSKIENAVSFIDAVQKHGLLTALQDEVSDEKTREELLQLLEPTTEAIDVDSYVEQSGITDPFNLTITPYIEHKETITVSDSTAQHEQSKQNSKEYV